MSKTKRAVPAAAVPLKVNAVEALWSSARARLNPLYHETRLLETEANEYQRLLDAAKQEA